MLKRTILLSVAAVAVTGCTTGYRVRVNGYSELGQPIASNAALFVAVDPNSANLIFDKQIKASTETLLRGYGYTVAETTATADYRLRFQIGMRSETVMGYTPDYHPAFGARGGYPGGLRFGFSTYTPYYDTIHDQWLILRLFQASADDPEAETLVWIGEATLTTERAELRQTVGYLLIGAIEYLGVDTGRNVTVKVERDDPRLLDITNP